MNENTFEDFIGKHVKIVYSDDGADKAMTGNIEDVTDEFVKIKDDRKRQLHLIKIERVVSISTVDWTYSEEREWR